MQTEIMNVTGMTCGGCVSSVARALKSVDGVVDAQVNLAGGQAVVQYDETRTTALKLSAALVVAGFGVTAAAASVTSPKKGGCCG